MKSLHFKDSFWNSDLTSTCGYDTIVQYMNDGKKTCKEVEEFMKARASVEEKYAKDLLGLSKKVCGHSEMNTLKKSLDLFKLHTEHVSLSHLKLAQSMRDEARKLEEFREKHKEIRKKMEQQMDTLHKQRSSQFRKTIEIKKTYEQKCRDKEEADQNVNRNTNTHNPKHIEKLNAKLQQAKQNAEAADKLYLLSVTTMEKMRDEWLMEHINVCETFENLARERIAFLRNTVWTHLNQLSQHCVSNDELYEDVRKSLEQCDVQNDIDHFVNLRWTGNKPPAPVLYENFYSGQKSATGPPPPQTSRLPPPVARRLAYQKDHTAEDDAALTPGYSTIQFYNN